MIVKDFAKRLDDVLDAEYAAAAALGAVLGDQHITDLDMVFGLGTSLTLSQKKAQLSAYNAWIQDSPFESYFQQLNDDYVPKVVSQPDGIIWAGYWCREMDDSASPYLAFQHPVLPKVFYSRREGYLPAMANMASPLELAKVYDPNRFQNGGSVSALMEALSFNIEASPDRVFSGFQSLENEVEFDRWAFGFDQDEGAWIRQSRWHLSVSKVGTALVHEPGSAWHIGSGPSRQGWSWDQVTVRFTDVSLLKERDSL